MKRRRRSGPLPTFQLSTRSASHRRRHQRNTDRLEQARTAVTTNWFAGYISPVIHVLPLALAVLLSSAAHFSSGCCSIRARTARCAAQTDSSLEAPLGTHDINATASAVSQDIRLKHGEELLILPEFLQSSFAARFKDTKPMLDWSCPSTSIISGMVMLTRVRTSSRHDQCSCHRQRCGQ